MFEYCVRLQRLRPPRQRKTAVGEGREKDRLTSRFSVCLFVFILNSVPLLFLNTRVKNS